MSEELPSAESLTPEQRVEEAFYVRISNKVLADVHRVLEANKLAVIEVEEKQVMDAVTNVINKHKAMFVQLVKEVLEVEMPQGGSVAITQATMDRLLSELQRHNINVKL